jgi:hypothetical protein
LRAAAAYIDYIDYMDYMDYNYMPRQGRRFVVQSHGTGTGTGTGTGPCG